MKVYVIEKGQYSDRHVVGVVETKEEADKICDILNRTDESYKDTTWTEYDTTQFHTDRLRFIVEYAFEQWFIEYDDYNLYSKYTESTCDYEGHYIIYAKTPEQALKIAQDMEAQLKAEKEGLI